jgi:acetate kinase
MMGTRAGSIDPGVMLALLREGRLTVDELADALDHRSGLLAVAGTADMREIVERAAGGHADARLAIELFVGRAAAGIAAAATALPALDALVFTGGIGEHAGSVREAIVGRLGVLRMCRVLTIEAREDLVIAADTAALVANR